MSDFDDLLPRVSSATNLTLDNPFDDPFADATRSTDQSTDPWAMASYYHSQAAEAAPETYSRTTQSSEYQDEPQAQTNRDFSLFDSGFGYDGTPKAPLAEAEPLYTAPKEQLPLPLEVESPVEKPITLPAKDEPVIDTSPLRVQDTTPQPRPILSPVEPAASFTSPTSPLSAQSAEPQPQPSTPKSGFAAHSSSSSSLQAQFTSSAPQSSSSTPGLQSRFPSDSTTRYDRIVSPLDTPNPSTFRPSIDQSFSSLSLGGEVPGWGAVAAPLAPAPAPVSEKHARNVSNGGEVDGEMVPAAPAKDTTELEVRMLLP